MKTKNLLKKAFLLLALMGGANSAWADTTPDYQSYDWSSADVIAAALGTHGDVTVSVETGASDGNVSGHWYKPLNGAIDGASGTYFQVSSSKQIDSIAVLYCPNGSNATNLVWAAWGEDVTPSAEVGSNYGTTTGTTGSKSWDAAVWEKINLSANSAYTVRISRQMKNCTNGGKKISNTGNNQTVNLLGFKVWLKPSAPASAPTITTQPSSAVYAIGATPAALTVEASASSGELSYQWYSNTTGTADPENDTAIDGATSSTLAAAKISTASAGTTYYYVVVTDANGSTTSDVATIEVASAIAPEVSATISAAVVRVGTIVTLTASIDAGIPVPTLQWYSCDSDGSNEVAVEGQTNTTYVFAPDAVGTYYYKVKASNAAGDDYSDVLTLTVGQAGVTGKTVSDLETITSDYVFVADDVTINGKLAPTANTLYEGGKIFTSFAATVATNKGSKTFGGGSHLNSLRLKNASASEYVAFKVNGPCVVTFYGDKRFSDPTPIKVGSAANSSDYGEIADSDDPTTLFIPVAGVVYITGGGKDRYIAGFEVKYSVPVTVGTYGFATYVPSYDLDFSTTSIEAYKVKVSTQGVATLTKVDNVPAGTPVLLYKEGGETENIPVMSGAGEVSDNDLVAGTGAAVATTEGDYTNMILNVVDEKIGFYFAAGNTVAANRAYLHFASTLAPDPVGGSSTARMAMRFAGDITGIDQVDNGQLTIDSSQPVKRVVNGKLVIEKNGQLFNANGQQVK